MSDAKCTHWHGAVIGGRWICGQCWMHQIQPVRFGMVERRIPILGGERGEPPEYRTVYRQEIIWRAPELVAESGLRMSQFVTAVAARITARSGLPDADAINAALEILRALGAEYASAAEDWSVEGAQEVADGDMDYWDDDFREDDGAND